MNITGLKAWALLVVIFLPPITQTYVKVVAAQKVEISHPVTQEPYEGYCEIHPDEEVCNK